MPKQLLIMDIGGSKTRAAIYTIEGSLFRQEHYEKIMTVHIESLAEFIREFIGKNSLFPEGETVLLISAAGPLKEGTVVLHNAKLRISEQELLREFAFENILLMNDMVAAAARINAQYARIDRSRLFLDGSISLGNARFIMIGEDDDEPEADDNAALAVIRAGTGLGISSVIIRDGKEHFVPSESARLPGQSFDEEDADFIEYVFSRYSRIATLEDMSSGSGVEKYYELLTSKKKSAKQMTMDQDEDLSAMQALRFFLKNQGRFAAAASNIFVPYRGIIITGNIIAGNRNLINNSGLRREYLTYSDIPDAKRIPLILYVEHDVNVKGCIEIAAKKIGAGNLEISQ